ncbi:hypothetical protein C5E07_09535 [Pseudoclavibacter sp. RFBJ3]|uniref:hypothetical protein n=1 Tax=unclassified Pseudoclavibacter TaxID=2615177 RepID=UPI000CE9191B|nr:MULTISPECIES: hypothetical protein [unclassified Pseudoclavibacter]PPF83729.1 hypothetical protein C5C12_08615 [Pseudoclavibacter sp. RFBJ5]PPF92009.1 hypothetical protein C5E07_09535 [Pseudoclavibacter sp. RFBJ3]PPF96872.1 hypothetical protein C5C19_12845 [Pseudoclavibacter sp. RFBH5]PPG23558.1 hypothetical protein C5E13_08230 [Pseudoclavibacter sp. RFBI4]
MTNSKTRSQTRKFAGLSGLAAVGALAGSLFAATPASAAGSAYYAFETQAACMTKWGAVVGGSVGTGSNVHIGPNACAQDTTGTFAGMYRLYVAYP